MGPGEGRQGVGTRGGGRWEEAGVDRGGDIGGGCGGGEWVWLGCLCLEGVLVCGAGSECGGGSW